MFNLLRAEVHKVVGNRLLAGLTLWVYPVGVVAFVVAITLITTLTPLPDTDYIFTPQPWDESMPAVWLILTGFPGNVFMRLFALSFMAVFFAGEYEWQTWKNIVPRRRRATLLLTKFLVLSSLLILSMAAASLLWGLGMGVFTQIVGQEYGPALTREVLVGFLPLYLLETGLAFGTALVLAGICALATLLTRSMVGSLLVGFGLSIIESISGLLFGWLAFVFDEPLIGGLYAYTPSYSIENLRAWYRLNAATPLDSIPGMAAEPLVVVSVAILAGWILVLAVISIIWFQRQNITS